MFITLTIFILFVIYLALRVRLFSKHRVNVLNNFTHRIHVNGIRGKSSVTRLIAASLREGKIKTIGKTTGTAARLVISHRRDMVIDRKEADIVEQKRMLDLHSNKGYDAFVFECMAINPIYQKYLEDKVMRSTIGVITNVREDHMDLLGKTLPQIAKSLSATVPKNGHLVTAETDPELLTILADACAKRGTKMHAVGNMRIANKHMAKFKHFEYKANVAIAIKVAKLTGIDRRTALRGMQKALPDPGAFVLRNIRRQKTTVRWANLFAINDRESFVLTTQSLIAKVGGNPKRVVILNNRHDRPERVAQFVDTSVNSVGVDYIVTFGDYEKQVAREARRHEAGKDLRIIHMGNSSKYKDLTGNKLLNSIVKEVGEHDFLLFGAVNIHTKQSRSLLKTLEKKSAH
jgi:gamma-polyglutamate synthase